jgi:hypothetical protein
MTGHQVYGHSKQAQPDYSSTRFLRLVHRCKRPRTLSSEVHQNGKAHVNERNAIFEAEMMRMESESSEEKDTNDWIRRHRGKMVTR